MTRTMYDAIYAQDLPEGGQLYAGYVDGQWPDYNNVVARFPGKVYVAIATSPNTNKGVVGDGPPDNGTWPEWVQWVKDRRAAGEDPSLNTDMTEWANGTAAFQSAGVAEPHWWIADYDGVAALAANEIAKQYASNNRFDTSIVADYWPGVDPAPAPPVPVPTPVTLDEDDFMKLVIAPRSGDAGAPTDVFILGNGQYKHVPTEGYVQDLMAAFTLATPELINYPLHGFLLANYNGVAVS